MNLKKTVENTNKRLKRIENEKRRNNVVLQGLRIDSEDRIELH